MNQRGWSAPSACSRSALLSASCSIRGHIALAALTPPRPAATTLLSLVSGIAEAQYRTPRRAPKAREAHPIARHNQVDCWSEWRVLDTFSGHVCTPAFFAQHSSMQPAHASLHDCDRHPMGSSRIQSWMMGKIAGRIPQTPRAAAAVYSLEDLDTR